MNNIETSSTIIDEIEQIIIAGIEIPIDNIALKLNLPIPVVNSIVKELADLIKEQIEKQINKPTFWGNLYSGICYLCSYFYGKTSSSLHSNQEPPTINIEKNQKPESQMTTPETTRNVSIYESSHITEQQPSSNINTDIKNTSISFLSTKTNKTSTTQDTIESVETTETTIPSNNQHKNILNISSQIIPILE